MNTELLLEKQKLKELKFLMVLIMNFQLLKMMLKKTLVKLDQNLIMKTIF